MKLLNIGKIIQNPQIIECFPNKTNDKYFVEFINTFEFYKKFK